MEKDDIRPLWLIIAPCIVVLLIATFAVGAYHTLKFVSPELQLIQTYPNWSYDEKMHYKYGAFYDLMHFVQQQTPPDSTIVIPPTQDPWYDAGNILMVRPYLYPRKILPGTDVVLSKLKGVRNSYMLIATGYNAQVWPSAPESYGAVTYIRAGWGVVDLSGR